MNVCSIRRAFTLLCAGHAQVVETDGGNYQTFGFEEWQDVSRHYQGHDVVRTISFKIRIPKVIVLLFYDRFPKKEVKFTRQNVFERDKNTCQYCGRAFDRKDLNLDHVVPRDRGGRMSWENIVCSCVECNTLKGNRTPDEAGMRLVHRPRRPKWRPSLVVSFSRHMDESWRSFLDISYWNVELGE